jgi:hypothetical protein
MNVDKDLLFESLSQARTIDLPRLKNHVAIAQNYREPESPGMLNRIQRLRIKAVGEGIINHEARHFQQVGIARILDTVALQSAEIIRVSELGSQVLKDLPVTLGTALSDLIYEVTLQIACYSIIVEQGIVHVEKVYGVRIVTCGSLHTISMLNLAKPGVDNDARKKGGPSISEVCALNCRLATPARYLQDTGFSTVLSRGVELEGLL